MIRGRVRIGDLAKELGVSASTVSRALSNEGRIGEKTRNSVIELAERWGYKPNPFAVNLLKKSSKNIGLVLPEFTHHYFSRILNGVNKVISEKGYHLFINTHDGSYEKEKIAINMLNGMRVDGIIAAYASETTDFSHYLDVIEEDVPLVFIDRLCEDLDTSYVVTDDFTGTGEAIDHLADSGCSKIIHIAGPKNLSTSFNRLLGYKDGLRRNGIMVDEELILQTEDPNWQKKFKMLLKNSDIDAVFAFNDYIAYEAMELLKESGKSIPDDVSLIGFADEPMALYMSPKLSTVNQPAEQMGIKAAETLIKNIENQELKTSQIEYTSMETKLVIRDTTKKIAIKKYQNHRRQQDTLDILKIA